MKYLLYIVVTSLALVVASCRDVVIDSGTGVVKKGPKDSTQVGDTSIHRGPGAGHPPSTLVSTLTLYYQKGDPNNSVRDSLSWENIDLFHYSFDKGGNGLPIRLKGLRFWVSVPSQKVPDNCSVGGLRSIEVNVPEADIDISPSSKVDLSWSPDVPDSSGAAIIVSPYTLPINTGYSFDRHGKSYRCSGSFQVTRVDPVTHFIDFRIDTRFFFITGGGGGDDVETMDADMSLRLRYQ